MRSEEQGGEREVTVTCSPVTLLVAFLTREASLKLTHLLVDPDGASDTMKYILLVSAPTSWDTDPKTRGIS